MLHASIMGKIVIFQKAKNLTVVIHMYPAHFLK